MSAMTTFIVAAALLVLLVLMILLPPLWRAPRTVIAVDRRQANLEIFRSQLAELEAERRQGALTAADFDQAKSELQRRLLEEVSPEAVPPAARGGRKTALALLIALPLAAAAAYATLGTPAALDAPQARVSAQQIDAMVEKLVARLKSNPDDSKGWIMLARTYKALGRTAEAAEAYSHVGQLLENDAMLLADYAELLGQLQGGSLVGRPLELITRALRIDPAEPQALFLAGAAATDRQDFPAVADYWGRLLLQLEPGSEEARSLEAAVDKAREIVAHSKGGTPLVAQAPGGSAASPPGKAVAASGEAISGEVVLSGKVAAQAGADDLLFIFARADEGSRMPLAVQRALVADLPIAFRFDDAMALPGGRKISEFATVSIEARVAKAGKAQSSSGDLFGVVRGVKPGSRSVKVVIDQVQP